MKAFLATAALLLVTGCKIMPVEEARELRERASGRFDGAAWVQRAWGTHLLPQLVAKAEPLPNALAPGRSLIVKGEGVVTAVDTTSRMGSVSLEGGVRLLTGPVIVSTALRDATPNLRFNDFADQLAFAAVNKALNDKAISATHARLASVKPGDRLHFIGAARAGEDGGVEIVPVRID